MLDRTFRPYEPDQLLLLPPSLGEWLPADHLAYFVSDVVTELDLTPIVKTYGGVTRGNAPYDPRLLVTILLYAYAVGIPASRQIARELEENVAFRVLAANQRPDFRTLSDFRKQHLAALTDLFVQVLQLCQRAGLVKLGHIALDGTKVKANASKHKAMSYGRMVTDEARLQAEVDALLQQAEAADVRDDATYGPDRRGDELPTELARREQRLQTIRTAKAVLEQEAQADAALKAAHDACETDGPRRGRPPQPPRSGPHPKAQRNFTDPESRIMPASDAKGSVIQGYNCQAAVDARAQIIVAADVTDEANDKQQAQPMLTQVLAQMGQVPQTVSMDAGYFSEANVTALTALGCRPLIPPDRQLHSQARPAVPRGRPPAGLSVADRMRRTLRTTHGRRLYARRKAIVEPVFGQIKQGRGYRQFLLRGMRQVRGEWALICTTHNLRKLWTALRQRRRCPGKGLRGLSGSRKTT
ncbi:MAG: IS1182 family transposase [Nitrospira sp.]|jgi:transposase|nr:IS1182 family transposase [Nitrospira sp.]